MRVFFSRRTAVAFSMSPPAAVGEALQSIIGGLVRSRSAFTSAAEMFMSQHLTPGLEDSPWGLEDNIMNSQARRRVFEPVGCWGLLKIRGRARVSGSAHPQEADYPG